MKILNDFDSLLGNNGAVHISSNHLIVVLEMFFAMLVKSPFTKKRRAVSLILSHTECLLNSRSAVWYRRLVEVLELQVRYVSASSSD